jgi:acetyl-CoA carboxylase/biotin carboxylase 1
VEIFIPLVRKIFFNISFIFFFVVEILIRLLETEAFITNTIKTSWLDGLIAERFQTEKPDIMISIICGAIHVADEKFRSNYQNFQSSLER